MNPSPAAPLRVVLVDFDWQDADFMLRLVGQPALSIRLVAGENPENPGMRLAQMSGLPRSTDLGDLTREIFDVALISPRSPRRDQVEALLSVLGTPSRSPSQFLHGLENGEPGAVATASPPASHALSLVPPPAGEDAAAAPPPPVEPPPGWAVPTDGADAGPAPAELLSHAADDREALEQALAALVEHSGAVHAELRMGTTDALEAVARVGEPDLLVEALVELAVRQDAEQVVRRIDERGADRISGAWPIRTSRRLGVLSASGIALDRPWEAWRDLAAQLRDDWIERDQPAAAPADTEAEAAGAWQTPEEFQRSLEQAVERNRDQNLRFGLHRYRFACRRPILDELCELLPRHLRDQDLLCRPLPQTVLLLTSGPADAFFRVNQRILQLWEGCWRMSADAESDPRLDMDAIELTSPDGGPQFMATAADWLGAEP